MKEFDLSNVLTVLCMEFDFEFECSSYRKSTVMIKDMEIMLVALR